MKRLQSKYNKCFNDVFTKILRCYCINYGRTTVRNFEIKTTFKGTVKEK